MTLPTSLHEFLSEHNGQSDEAKLGIYVGSQILSTDGIRAQWDTWKAIDCELMNEDCAEFMSSKPAGAIKSMYTNERWIPLTHDWAGNHVGLDFDPDTRGKIGQVIAFGRDQDEKVLLADSFDEFLDNFASELRNTDWTFANDHRDADELATETPDLNPQMPAQNPGGNSGEQDDGLFIAPFDVKVALLSAQGTGLLVHIRILWRPRREAIYIAVEHAEGGCGQYCYR